MRLILIRHGETVQNYTGVCQGQGDGQLSNTGREQARKLGLRFKDKHIDALYSSDLTRAMDTAEEIRKHHEGLELIIDKRLRERYFGKLEGTVRPNIDWDNLPSYVETDQQLYDRARSFLDDALDLYEGKTVVAVTHGGMKRTFYTLLHGLPVEHNKDWEPIHNTSVSEFDVARDGQHKVYLMNCIEHY